jgi:hypothetical protein
MWEVQANNQARTYGTVAGAPGVEPGPDDIARLLAYRTWPARSSNAGEPFFHAGVLRGTISAGRGEYRFAGLARTTALHHRE